MTSRDQYSDVSLQDALDALDTLPDAEFLPGGSEPNDKVTFVAEDGQGTPVKTMDELMDRIADNLTSGRISGGKPGPT